MPPENPDLKPCMEPPDKRNVVNEQGCFMRRRLVLISTVALTSLVGCSQFENNGRTYLTEMEQDDSSFFAPREDFPIVAGDTGRFWSTEKERKARTPASIHDVEMDRAHVALENERRDLEENQSESAREFYNEHKNKLSNTSEKIYFLRLPKSERREYLMSRGLITEKPSKEAQENRISAVSHSEIMLGMNKSDVMASLGNPSRVEVAGNPSYENERWIYRVNGAMKYIYFESGQVGGWE